METEGAVRISQFKDSLSSEGDMYIEFTELL